MKSQKGITLIALIITIIVLAILAAVSITALTGQNGVVKEALQTSEEKTIADERESVTTSYMGAAMKNHGYGTTVDSLQAELDATVGEGKTEVTEVDGELIVKYVETGRSYVAGNVYVNDGNVGVGKVYADPDEWTHIIDTTTNTATITKCKITGAKEITIPNYVRTNNGDVPVKKVKGTANDINYGNIYDFGNSIWSDVTETLYYPLQNTIEKIIVSEGIEEISEFAFCGTENLKEVVLPNSIKSIGNYVFAECKSLTDIIIPNSVTSLGEMVFSQCTNLSEITIPNSITSMEDGVFESCTSLTNITIPNSVTNIGNYTFYCCESLAKVTIPNSVTSIGKYAFSSTGLTSMIIPNNVASIGDNAFSYCESLAEIIIPDSVTNIGHSAFYKTGLKNIVWPSNVTVIDIHTFANSSLESIVIPKSVKSIEYNAFSNGTNLKDIYYTGTESEWNSITKGYMNDCLTSATKHYNYVQQ